MCTMRGIDFKPHAILCRPCLHVARIDQFNDELEDDSVTHLKEGYADLVKSDAPCAPPHDPNVERGSQHHDKNRFISCFHYFTEDQSGSTHCLAPLWKYGTPFTSQAFARMHLC